MNQRPSTRILALPRALTGDRSARSLRRRLLAGTAIAAIGVLAALAFAGDRRLAPLDERRRGRAHRQRRVALHAARRSRPRRTCAAGRTHRVHALRGRRRQERLAEAKQHGLPAQMGNTMSAAALNGIEARYKATRSLQVDRRDHPIPHRAAAQAGHRRSDGDRPVRLQRRDDVALLGLRAERRSVVANGVENGHDARGGDRRSRDAPDRRRAGQQWSTTAPRAVGVVKVKFGLSLVDSVLAQGAAGSALRVDLVDSVGQVIASSAPGSRFKRFAGFAAATAGAHTGTTFTFDEDSTPRRGFALSQRTAAAGGWSRT